MVLGQLRMGARQAKNAPLLLGALIDVTLMKIAPLELLMLMIVQRKAQSLSDRLQLGKSMATNWIVW